MNKALAEILASVIPVKYIRNQWRGKLRYGIFKSLKLKRDVKRNKEVPQCYLAICAIAKNEGPYFKEWIEWHRKKGVERFYIYDNESTDNTKEVLKPYIAEGIVEYNYWPGKKQQLATYDDCFARHRFDTRWIAVIDLDEFIVPVVNKTIPEFLRPLENFAVVEINWLVYGSGNLSEYTPEPVMQRFRYHSIENHYLNRHVKSIVNPRKVSNMIGSHEAARISGKASDSHGKIIRKSFRDRTPLQDVIKINHYAVKSYEEFCDKRGKGRASGKQKPLEEGYFKEFDLNDLFDSTEYN